MKDKIEIKVMPKMEPNHTQRLVADLWTDPAFKELRERMGGDFVHNLSTRFEVAAIRDAEAVRRLSEATIANLSATADRLSRRCEEVTKRLEGIVQDYGKLLKERDGGKQ